MTTDTVSPRIPTRPLPAMPSPHTHPARVARRSIPPSSSQIPMVAIQACPPRQIHLVQTYRSHTQTTRPQSLPNISAVAASTVALQRSVDCLFNSLNLISLQPPGWRKSTLNPGKIVCNKCGLYERSHARPRPLHMDNPKGPTQ
ncbi:hypothetical protein B0J17DRAFT_16759 [Rhizoctonia solani]|nr:hypothetical protein B0J17DRAFT_16759 [Rhizoctonia solani]